MTDAVHKAKPPVYSENDFSDSHNITCSGSATGECDDCDHSRTCNFKGDPTIIHKRTPNGEKNPKF